MKTGNSYYVKACARWQLQAVGTFSIIAACLLLTGCAWAHDDEQKQPGGSDAHVIQSRPGENAWNAGQPPKDWWAEIRRQHGHVGPWNIVGWRIGQAALREFDFRWGRHELEIVCYVPLQTPFTCLADGLAVGTGNSIGRLDLRLAEVFTAGEIFVAVRRKDHKGAVLEFRPDPQFLKTITNRPVQELERLSHECAELEEAKVFRVHRLEQ